MLVAIHLQIYITTDVTVMDKPTSEKRKHTDTTSRFKLHWIQRIRTQGRKKRQSSIQLRRVFFIWKWHGQVKTLPKRPTSNKKRLQNISKKKHLFWQNILNEIRAVDKCIRGIFCRNLIQLHNDKFKSISQLQFKRHHRSYISDHSFRQCEILTV